MLSLPLLLFVYKRQHPINCLVRLTIAVVQNKLLKRNSALLVRIMKIYA